MGGGSQAPAGLLTKYDLSWDAVRPWLLHLQVAIVAAKTISWRGNGAGVFFFLVVLVSLWEQFGLYYILWPGLRAKSRARRVLNTMSEKDRADPEVVRKVELRELRKSLAARVRCDSQGWEWGASDDELPGLSIIRPCFGTNSCLERNYESTFAIQFPKFELLFCVHKESDAAVPVIRALMAKYPHVDAKLLVGDAGLAHVNPVINNLAKGYDAAKYDLIWRLDSRAVTSTADAYCIVEQMRPRGIRLVHQLPVRAHVEQNDPCGRMERFYFCMQHARGIATPNLAGMTGMVGLSFAVKRSTWDAVGGYRALALHNADDSLIGSRCDEQGFKTCMAAVPAVQNSPVADLPTFVERLKRWRMLRMREASFIRWIVALELWLEHFVSACLAVSLSPIASFWSAVAAVLVLTIAAFAVDALVNTAIIRHATFVPEWRAPPDGVLDWIKGTVWGPIVPFEIAWRSLTACLYKKGATWTCNGKTMAMPTQEKDDKKNGKREKERLGVDLAVMQMVNGPSIILLGGIVIANVSATVYFLQN
jgi:ceramide glucosyltransferase